MADANIRKEFTGIQAGSRTSSRKSAAYLTA